MRELTVSCLPVDIYSTLYLNSTGDEVAFYPMGKPVQRWAKRWTLGCVNSPLKEGGGCQEAGFMQTRAHGPLYRPFMYIWKKRSSWGMELWNFSKFVKSFLGLGNNRGLHVRERASAGVSSTPRGDIHPTSSSSSRVLHSLSCFPRDRVTDASARGEPIVVDVFFPFS